MPKNGATTSIKLPKGATRESRNQARRFRGGRCAPTLRTVCRARRPAGRSPRNSLVSRVSCRARTELADDFDRILDHLPAHDVEGIPARIRGIIEAFDVLQSNPLIGRPVPLGKRELIIGRGSRGCVALYRYVLEIDSIFVLALRSQSEGGCKHD